MNATRRTERGWGGHYICASRCRFRRNTLLELGAVRIVLSTVGNLRLDDNADQPEEIGPDRLYETMAFCTYLDGSYLEADVNRQVYFDAPWAIGPPLTDDCDNLADAQHERVVDELMRRMDAGETFTTRKSKRGSA